MVEMVENIKKMIMKNSGMDQLDAVNLAKKVAEKKYAEVVEKALKELRDYGDYLLDKYVPKELSSLALEYPEFFKKTGYSGFPQKDDNSIEIYYLPFPELSKKHNIYNIKNEYCILTSKCNNFKNYDFNVDFIDFNKAMILNHKYAELIGKRMVLEDVLKNAFLSISYIDDLFSLFPETKEFLTPEMIDRNFLETLVKNDKLVPNYSELRMPLINLIKNK